MTPHLHKNLGQTLLKREGYTLIMSPRKLIKFFIFKQNKIDKSNKMTHHLSALVFVFYIFQFPLTISAQLSEEVSFVHEENLIKVIKNGKQINNPFSKVINKGDGGIAVGDLDCDGDLDLLAGSSRYGIAFYLNIGTKTEPSFQLKQDSIVDLYQYSLTPTLVDIDNDEDLDLFVGNSFRPIAFYENVGSCDSFEFNRITDTIAEFEFGGQASASFPDIDGDGDFDLIFSSAFGLNKDFISFFENVGTAENFQFKHVTDTFAGILPRRGSVTTFNDIDGDGDLDLFIADEHFGFDFYMNNGNANTWDYKRVTSNFSNTSLKGESHPSFADLNDDGVIDLIVRLKGGEVSYYKNNGSRIQALLEIETKNILHELDFGGYAFPSLVDIDLDNDIDLFVGSEAGNISFYRNTGSKSQPVFSFVTDTFAGISIPKSLPVFGDIDLDGDIDIIIGTNSNTRPIYFRNEGGFYTQETLSNVIWKAAIPALVDIDNDGDLDLFMSEFNEYQGRPTGQGRLHFYENCKPSESNPFQLITSNFANLSGFNLAITFGDLDEDGDFDIIRGGEHLRLYPNIGDKSIPGFGDFFIRPGERGLNFESSPYLVKYVSIEDINGDGLGDVITGNTQGTLSFFKNRNLMLPRVELSKSGIGFGSLFPGDTSFEEFSIINSGNALLEIKAINPYKRYKLISTDEFRIFSPKEFPIEIMPGDSERIVVSFNPQSSGLISGFLSITSNVDEAFNFRHAMSLTGRSLALNPPIDLFPMSVKRDSVWLSWKPPLIEDQNLLFYDDGTIEEFVVGLLSGFEFLVQFTPPFYPARLIGTIFIAGGEGVSKGRVLVYIDPFSINEGPLYNIPLIERDFETNEISLVGVSFDQPLLIQEGDFFISLKNETENFAVAYDTDQEQYRSWLNIYSDYRQAVNNPEIRDGDFVIGAVIENPNSNEQIVIGIDSLPGFSLSKDMNAVKIRNSLKPINSIKQDSFFSTKYFIEKRNNESTLFRSNPEPNLLGFNIYRLDSLNQELTSETKIGSVTSNVFEFLDLYSGLDSTYYAVTALYDKGESLPSNIIAVNPGRNHPPFAINRISDTLLMINSNHFISDLLGQNPIFADPDGDVLNFKSSSSDESISTTSLIGSKLFVRAHNPGASIIEVQALDPSRDTATTFFLVEVVREITTAIHDLTLNKFKLGQNFPNPFKPTNNH